jgi:hypothetical protein
MKLKFIFILLAVFCISCNQKEGQEATKYKITYGDDEKSLKIYDDNKNEIIFLAFNEDGSINTLHTDYEGFYLSVGRFSNGEFYFLVVRDENTNYNSLTQLKHQEEGVLVYRQEQYKTFSNEYRLFEDGKTNIKHWNYDNETWLEE